MKGLHINNNIIEYVERPLEETGSIRKTKAFKTDLESIEIIAVRAIVLIDDEDFIITLVDHDKNEYKFSSLEFETSAGKILEKKFNISINKLWGTFTYNQHCSGANRILFPYELQGKQLYENTFDSINSFVASINTFTDPYKGVLRNEINLYIDKLNSEKMKINVT